MTERLVIAMHTDGTRDDYTFALTGGPIEDLGEGIKAFTALGHAAVAWSRIEKHLEILIVHLNKPIHSAKPLNLFDPNHPWPFIDKLELLKDYFNKHPALSQHKEEFRKITSELKLAWRDRNAFMHSILEDYDADSEMLHFKTIEPKAPKGSNLFRVEARDVPYEYVLYFITRAIKLNTRLAGISETLFTPDALARLKTL